MITETNPLPETSQTRPEAAQNALQTTQKAGKAHYPPPPSPKRPFRTASGRIARLPLEVRSSLASALAAGQSYVQAAATAGITNISRKSIASWWRTAEAKRIAQAVAISPAEAEALARYSTAIALSAEAAHAIIEACIADPKPAHAFALQAAQATIKAAHTHKSQALAAAQQPFATELRP